MTDPWARWDEQVKRSGNTARVADELTDAELLALLACETDRHRETEKRILKQEAFERMAAAHPPSPGQAERERQHYEREPADGPTSPITFAPPRLDYG